MADTSHYVEVVRYRLDGSMTVNKTHGPYPEAGMADRVAAHIRGEINAMEFFVRVVSHA